MKFGIIGAGPSGLAMSRFIKYDSVVFERSNSPGGHAGSFTDHGYTFDHGPHILFSKDKHILQYLLNLLGNNVHACKRNNKISYKGTLVKYPFENDLKSLPLEDNYECLAGYIFNPYKKKYKKPKNFKEWLLAHFGRGICEKYLFPYNEKVWNIPVDRLSMIWADRLPQPPPEDILKSAIGYETEGYLHQLFYNYPLKGGYQAISEQLAEGTDIRYQFAVTKITKEKGKFVITNGLERHTFDQIISTMPIQELIKILDLKIPPKVLKAISSLIVNPMHVVSLGIKGVDANQYTAVYFPEKEYLVNRISFPATFSPHNAPAGYHSIQAEITCKARSAVWKWSDEQILQHTIDGLIDRNIISQKNDIVYTNVTRHPYAYVVYDTQYEKNVKIVRDWFPKQGIHLVGRFSYFEYINVDGVIKTALEIASKINGKSMTITAKGVIV